MQLTGTTPLSILPFQLIEMKDCVYLKRGINQICITGENAVASIIILQRVLAKKSMTLDEILALFAGIERDAIHALIKQLIKRRFIVPQGDAYSQLREEEIAESAEDIFYWHFDLNVNKVEKLNSEPIAIIGVNKLGLATYQSLLSNHTHNLTLIDDVPLRNYEFSQPEGQLVQKSLEKYNIFDIESLNQDKLKSFAMLVVCSDFGGQSILREWNRYAVQLKLPIIPVFLDDMIGYIGPLTIPNETACLECFYARQNSHLNNFKEREALKQHEHQGKAFVAYHPAMLNILAEVAAFEIMRFRTNTWQHKIGKLIEINLISTTMSAHKIVKVPRCPTCSAMHEFPPPDINKKRLTEQDLQKLEMFGGDD